jgi:HNH endonuclease
MTHRIISDWHKIYRKNYKKEKFTDEWVKAKAACLKRDKNTCQRCDRKGNDSRSLTAHHRIPRAEDGSDDLSNLITLCNPCHDYVEIRNLRTWAEIIGSYEDEINGNFTDAEKEETEDRTDEGYHFTRPEWHKYVYGGQKRRK